MGQAAPLLIGAAGAIAGGLTFGAGWAVSAGFLGGELLGAILFPPKAPSPPDLRVQDSAYGRWIPLVWGRNRISGNIIWMGTPHSHSSGGGKGAGGKGSQPYTTLSFAVGLCQGPITSVTRIWANGKLIYDTSDPSDWQSLSGSSSMVTNFTVYDGNETQLPDPVIESYLGANTPAYRGLAYVVFNELSLQQWGNYLPSLTFEVQGAGASTLHGSPTITATGMPNAYASPIITSIVNGTAYGWQITSEHSGLGNEDMWWTSFQLTPYGTVWGATFNAGFVTNMMAMTGYQCIDQDGYGRVLDNGGNLWVPNVGYAGSVAPGTGLDWGIIALISDGYVFSTVGIATGVTSGNNYIGTISGGTGAGYVASKYAPSISLYIYFDGTYLYAIDHNSHFVKLDTAGDLMQDYGVTPFGIGNAATGFGPTQLYVAAKGVVWQWDGIGWANSGKPAPTQSGTLAFVAGNAVVGYQGSMIMASQAANASVTVATVVQACCEAAGLQASQYDVSQLTETVIGYLSNENSSPRDILQPLLQSYFVDVSDADGLLKFIPRGSTPTVTIPWDDLGADSSGGSSNSSVQAQNPVQETLLQEYELPRTETLTYVSASTDYQPGTQRAFRANTVSNLDESTNVPVVLADNDAMLRAQAMLWERWSRRRSFTFSSGYKWLYLEPGDVVNLQTQNGQLIPVVITKMQLDGKGVITFSADFTVPQIYPQPGSDIVMQAMQGGVADGFVRQKVDYSGPTILRVMDLPPLRAADAGNPGVYLAACGMATNWPGCLVDLSRDDVNFSQASNIVNASAIGICQTTLGSFAGGNIPDETSTLTVQMYDDGPELSSVSWASFLNGANAALVGAELIYFRRAQQTATNTFVLSGLLRGQIGTEAAMGTHGAYEPFVLLSSSTVTTIPLQLTDLNSPLYFQTALNNLFGTAQSPVQTVKAKLQRLAPLSPWQPAAFHGSSTSLNDITLKWFRRARINYAWVDGADVPLDFSQESYRIGVYNGATLKNTYTVTGPFTAQPAFTYSAAQITADGFTTGTTITFSVQQIGDYGVPGGIATTTITR
ncbi:phage tail protein [Burkholderia multivorans]|uniref:phage tail protein n=1 Tax=Burkholderia multivorans TaxID=87883 RepID=UPI001C240162|nr:phage tail protein [Burkholderia multivorans]MBU9608256.1 phage tail protein [Burkholderia multivorans]